MLAAAVTLTNFAQAEVTGKAVPPVSGVCPNVSGTGFRFALSDSMNPPATPIITCVETRGEFDAINGLNVGSSLTLTTATERFVVLKRAIGIMRYNYIVSTLALTPPPDPNPAPDPNPTNPPDNNNGNMDDGNAQMPDNTPTTPQTPAATVQAKSSDDAKRLAQYGAAGFAAVVLIHNYWFAAPGAALPFHLAFNEKGAIYSGTSFRLSPRETLHLSALESLDDKRGEYKFGVQWHYQFAPPRGTTKTPQAAPPAVYTMPNVKPKDWLKK